MARSGAIVALRGFIRGCTCAAAGAIATLACALAPGFAADATQPKVETVHFDPPLWPAVRVVRGITPVAPPLARALPSTTQIVNFGSAGRVRIVRGGGVELPRPADMAVRIETVRFGGFGAHAVTIMRGGAADGGVALFGAANDAELDRVAFAVDGAESGHGANLAMWRPELDGPQGPMQVSAAAALDFGGGDRFDMRENRQLGRAFLAHMYQRYGNWPDAIAAYNWGPGHLDQWIAAGRPTDKLPLETARYLLKVMHDAFLIDFPRL
jgi:hypothetical protein